jgi:hypothetical protein
MWPTLSHAHVRYMREREKRQTGRQTDRERERERERERVRNGIPEILVLLFKSSSNPSTLNPKP